MGEARLRVGEGRAVIVDEEVAEVVGVLGQLALRPLGRLKKFCVRSCWRI